MVAPTRLLPFWLRVELLRLRRAASWIVETRLIARRRLPAAECNRYGHTLAVHSSPLERVPGAVPAHLQRGKERNVTLAAALLDRLLILPGEIFSYHRCIGRPTRGRGFRLGLEMHDGRPVGGVGGGCCQVSNALYYLALRAGMKIVERHRHGLDLFPDHQRTVPFGCGATVFYNYADLRWEDPLSQPVLLRAAVSGAELVVGLNAESDPGWSVEVYETDHRFFRQGDERWRENRIRRRFTQADGALLLDEEVAHNRGRVLYDPPEETGC